MKLVSHLYCVYDTISKNLSHFGLYSSDGLAARSILSTLQVPLKDTQLIRLSTLQSDLDSPLDDVHSFSPIQFEKVPWSCYKFPETVAEALSPLNLSVDELKEIVKEKTLNK